MRTLFDRAAQHNSRSIDFFGTQLTLPPEGLFGSVRDVGDYSEDDTIDRLLDGDTALGRLVNHTLDPESAGRAAGPYSQAVAEWEELERFVESRLRRE